MRRISPRQLGFRPFMRKRMPNAIRTCNDLLINLYDIKEQELTSTSEDNYGYAVKICKHVENVRKIAFGEDAVDNFSMVRDDIEVEAELEKYKSLMRYLD